MAYNEGKRICLFTFTDISPAHARPLHKDEFCKRIRAFIRALDRKGVAPAEYLAVWGVNSETGRLHRHVLAIDQPFIRRNLLREIGIRNGLWRDGCPKAGIDLRAVTATGHSFQNRAVYLAGNAFHYAEHERNGGGRIRPVTRSRGF
jgi:hypothetical protein